MLTAPARSVRAKPTLFSPSLASAAACAVARTSSPSALWLLLLLVSCLSSLPTAVHAQQPMPFLGRGDSPPASPVDVHVTAYLDRLLDVDDKEYAFSAVVWFYLTWIDPRVKGQIAENAAKLANETLGYKCDDPCQSNQKAMAGGCCDGVWSPYIAFSNLKWLPQDRVVRYGFGFDPESDAVFQWRSVHASYYTPMDLRAFPFDTQQLLIQMEVPQARNGWSGGLVNLIPSTTGTSLFTAKTGGDDVSGWGVRTVRLVPFEYPLCQATMGGALGPSATGDPYPVMPQYMWDYKVGKNTGADTATCSDVLLADPAVGAKSPFWRNPLTNATASTVKREPIPVSGLNCIILVNRFTTRWVLSAIFPIMATTWLGFLVFFLPRDDMNGRLGSIVALFLALAAIQFVVDQDVPASSYITPLQQLTLTSYLSLILVGFECVIIWYLTTYHVEKVKLRRHLEAQRSYQAKLAAIKTALDAWLVKAQATYRRAPERTASKLPWGGSSPKKKAAAAATAAAAAAADDLAAAAAAADGDAAAAAAAVDARPDIGSNDSTTSVQSPLQSAAPTSTAAAAAAPSVTAAPDAPVGEVRLLVSNALSRGHASSVSGSSKPQRELAAAAAVGSDRNMRSMESIALADAATQAAIAAAELARTEAETGQHPSVAHRTGLLRFMRARDDPSSEDPLSPPAALSAAAAGDDHSISSGSAAAAAGGRQQQPGSSGSGWRLRQAVPAGSSAVGVGSPSAAAAASRDQQQPATAAAAAGASFTTAGQPRNSSGGGGGMGSLVAELLAAQGKELPGQSQQQQQQQGEGSRGNRGGAAASGGGAAGPAASGMSGGGAGRDVLESLVRKLQRQGLTGDSWHARLRQRMHLFLNAIYSDEGFADRIAHKCNKWCAITQWVAYNAAAILIFAVNSYVYRVY